MRSVCVKLRVGHSQSLHVHTSGNSITQLDTQYVLSCMHALNEGGKIEKSAFLQTLLITECVALLYIAKQKETVKQSVAMEKNARAKLKEIQQKMKDSKSHHERELKEAEASITRAKKEAESVVKEAKSREQEMQALTLEVEELQKGLEAQQRQVSGSREPVNTLYHVVKVTNV